jgi:hypothetical protein
MPAPSEEKLFKYYPGRARKREIEDRLEDKEGRSLVRQHDAQPDWGRETENKLAKKRNMNGPQGIF